MFLVNLVLQRNINIIYKYQEIKNGLTEPFARVIDDAAVVGIITIADQFIPVNDLMSEDKIDFNEPERI